MREDTGMSFANFFSGAIVLLLGCAFRANGAYDGLTGFDRLREEEWDKPAMGRFITTLMIVAGAVLLVGGVLIAVGFYPEVSLIVTWVFMFAMLLGGVVYANVSGRFKKGGHS
jgi:hypothetical protein